MRKFLTNRRRRRAFRAAVSLLDPDDAAQLVRAYVREKSGDKFTLLTLVERAQQSDSPGNAEAMRRYAAAIKAGRTIKYSTFHAEFRTVNVPDEMRAEIEEALQQGDETS